MIDLEEGKFVFVHIPDEPLPDDCKPWSRRDGTGLSKLNPKLESELGR